MTKEGNLTLSRRSASLAMAERRALTAWAHQRHLVGVGVMPTPTASDGYGQQRSKQLDDDDTAIGVVEIIGLGGHRTLLDGELNAGPGVILPPPLFFFAAPDLLDDERR